jgi:acyl-ACP thioesterase
MQETSNAHLDSMGHNLDSLRDEHSLAFLLSKTKLAIYEPLYFPEDITVKTFTSESRGFAFNRFYQIYRGEQLIASADTTWALIDLKTKKLCKTDVFDFGFEHEAPIDIGVPQRFRVAHNEELKLLGQRDIVYSDLDYNMHMNNTKYADMLCDFMPIEDVPRIRSISISYLHEAAFKDNISVFGSGTNEKYSFRTVNQNGDTGIEAEIILK